MIPRPDIENTRSLYADFETAEPYEYYRKAMALAEEIPALLAYIDALEAVRDAAEAYFEHGGEANMRVLFDALDAVQSEDEQS